MDKSHKKVVALYRPVGQKELDLIAESGWSKFPPRLDWQPIFYPVLNEEYATLIAKQWNTKDKHNGSVGYVLKFKVEKNYIAQYPIQRVGDETCKEYWIPAEELSEFNNNIIGKIELISEWRKN